MPDQEVKKVVTDRVLDYDSWSCAAILDKMLQEKKNEEDKVSAIQTRREGLRD